MKSFMQNRAVGVSPSCDSARVRRPVSGFSLIIPCALHRAVLVPHCLRGDPHHDFQFSVLVNYRDTAYPLEIVNVDMLRGNDG